MTFEEWKEKNLNMFAHSREVFVAYEAWQQQQERIDELEEKLEERNQKHLDSIRALRKANDNVTKIAKDNLALLGDIEALEAQLKVSDLRPIGESEYLERIDELKKANNDLARAAIRPDGYVLVPVEPTTAMEEAFLDIYEKRGWFMRGYKNMIKAAQAGEQ